MEAEEHSSGSTEQLVAATFPPRPVCIVGALAIALGVSSVLRMISNILLDQQMMVDLSFVAIPIGYGLLSGRSSSRSWALFFSVLGLLAVAVFGLLFCLEALFGLDLGLSYSGSLPVAVYLLLAAVPMLYVVQVLKRHRSWFDRPSSQPGPLVSVAWAVVVVVGVMWMGHSLQQRAVQQALEEMFDYHVTIEAYNGETGERMGSIMWNRSPPHASNDKSLIPTSYCVRISGGPEAWRIRISGIADQPFEVVIVAEGFHHETIVVDRNTEEFIRLPMRPLEDSDVR